MAPVWRGCGAPTSLALSKEGKSISQVSKTASIYSVLVINLHVIEEMPLE